MKKLRFFCFPAALIIILLLIFAGKTAVSADANTTTKEPVSVTASISFDKMADTMYVDDVEYTRRVYNNMALYVSKAGKLGAVYVPFTSKEAAYNQTKYDLKLTLPSYIKSIAPDAFSGTDYYTGYCCALNELVIPAGVTLDMEALYGLNAKKVTYNASTVPTYCFDNANITNLVLTSTVRTISEGAFSFGNFGMISVGSGVTKIGDNAFYCADITTLSIGAKLSALTYDMFGYNLNAKNLKIWGSSINTIDTDCFYASDLETVTLGSCVRTLKSAAFYGSENLTSITGPAVTDIENKCFSRCTSLKTVSLPKITGIPDYAFAGTAITTYTIPSTVVSMGTGIFGGSSLTTITIPSSVKGFASGIFTDCENLRTIYVPSAEFIENVFYLGAPYATIVAPTNSPELYYMHRICKNKIAPSSAVCLNYTNLTLLKGDEELLQLCNTYKWKGTFKSENTKIATVTSKGVVKGVGCGTTNIIVTYNNKTYKCKITVLSRTVQNRCKQMDWNYGLSYLSDENIAFACFAWMQLYCNYDYTFSRYGAADILLDYTGVCNAYMLATEELMNYFGIPNKNCISYEMNHGWNIVKIGKNYFHIDATWGNYLYTDAEIQSADSGQGSGLPKAGHYGYSPSGLCKYTYIDTNYYTKIRKLRAPSVSVTNTQNCIQISWNRVRNATGYTIYKKTGNGAYTKLYTVTSGTKLSIVDKNVKAGTSYSYYVVANAPGVKSPNSVTKTIVRLSAPSVTLTNSSVSVKVSWNKQTGAAGYYVYRKEGNGKWVKIATTTSAASAYWDKSAVKGKTYTYTVKAYKGSSTSFGLTKTIKH